MHHINIVDDLHTLNAFRFEPLTLRLRHFFFVFYFVVRRQNYIHLALIYVLK